MVLVQNGQKNKNKKKNVEGARHYHNISYIATKGRLWYRYGDGGGHEKYNNNNNVSTQYNNTHCVYTIYGSYTAAALSARQPWEQRCRERRRPRRDIVRGRSAERRGGRTAAARRRERGARARERARATTVHAAKHQRRLLRARVGPFVSRRARCVVTRHRRSSLLTSVRYRAPCVRNFGPPPHTHTRRPRSR